MSISMVFMAPIELSCLIPIQTSLGYHYQGFEGASKLPPPHRIWIRLITVIAWITHSIIHFLLQTKLNQGIVFDFSLNILEILTLSLMGITRGFQRLFPVAVFPVAATTA